LRQSRTSKELRCSKNEREYLPNLAASLSNSFGQHPRRHVILSLSKVILSLSKDAAAGRHCSSSANR
jgi:KaiC/GvpD/RAD55 family RecA-like ATPase